MINKKLPNFIIVGAGKCGTTSLHNYLSQHPQVYICPQKETFFFMGEEQRNKNKKWGAVTSIEEYSKLFAQAPENSVVGEISTVYYAHEKSASLIHQYLPQTKIVAILRDPAQRAFSDYQMHFRKGREKRDFNTTIQAKRQYIRQGFYYAELKPFFEIFNRDQIKILLYEDLAKNPLGFIQDLFRYIEVDDQFIPDMSKRGRDSGMAKNTALNRLLNKQNLFTKALKTVIPNSVINKLIKQNSYKPKLSIEDRNQLIQIYREDILKLQDLLELDLSAWLSHN